MCFFKGTSQTFADHHLPEIEHSMITKQRIERDKEGSFVADNAFSGDKISSGSARTIPDTGISANTRNVSRRQPPPLVRRKKVEITEDMLPVFENKTGSANEGSDEKQPDDDILHADVSAEAENNDDMDDDADIRNVIDDTTSLTRESREKENSPREQYPPINTFYICLIIGKGNVRKMIVISKCTFIL